MLLNDQVGAFGRPRITCPFLAAVAASEDRVISREQSIVVINLNSLPRLKDTNDPIERIEPRTVKRRFVELSAQRGAIALRAQARAESCGLRTGDSRAAG